MYLSEEAEEGRRTLVVDQEKTTELFENMLGDALLVTVFPNHVEKSRKIESSHSGNVDFFSLIYLGNTKTIYLIESFFLHLSLSLNNIYLSRLSPVCLSSFIGIWTRSMRQVLPDESPVGTQGLIRSRSRKQPLYSGFD